MNNNRWTAEDIPDLDGRVAVVTGANSGLGFYTSRALAAKGAQVVMACRALTKGQAAASIICQEFPAAFVEVVGLDLANLSSVRSFAAGLSERHAKLDLLINNAGVMGIPYRKTADGFEMQFGTNHLGHFALTGLLLGNLLAASSPRIVTLSSAIHVLGKLDFSGLNGAHGYSKSRAYNQSKLANLLFAYELQRRLDKAGYNQAISVAVHPGYAATNLQLVGPAMERNPLLSSVMKLGNALVAQSAEMGALPTLYAATAAAVRGCEYFGPGGFLGLRGYPIKMRSSAASYDEQAARQLWQISEELTQVSYGWLEVQPAP